MAADDGGVVDWVDGIVWRVRALNLAKRLRADDPWATSMALAEAIAREVEGAPRRLDPIGDRIRAWERMGDLPVRLTRGGG